MVTFMFFTANNKPAIIGMLVGLILGYVHWYYCGCYWGTYPMSSECWVNCIGGMLCGGFIGSLLYEGRNEKR